VPAKRKSQEGQALIIILMVMVLSLATGLAVSTRTTSTVHQTTNLANSEQALASAESAVEEILATSNLPGCDANCNNNAATIGNTHLYKSAKGSAADCTAFPCYRDFSAGGDWSTGAIVTVDNTPDFDTNTPFTFFLEKNDVQQVWLDTSGVTSLDICWQKDSEAGPDVALEIIAIKDDSGSYSLAKYAFDSEALSRLNGFDGSLDAGRDIMGSHYNFCKNNLDIGSTTKALRVRSFYGGSSVVVAPATGQTNKIQYQGHVITSTGYFGDAQRTIEVTKTLPQLPAIFDYAVYSGGALTK